MHDSKKSLSRFNPAHTGDPGDLFGSPDLGHIGLDIHGDIFGDDDDDDEDDDDSDGLVGDMLFGSPITHFDSDIEDDEVFIGDVLQGGLFSRLGKRFRAIKRQARRALSDGADPQAVADHVRSKVLAARKKAVAKRPSAPITLGTNNGAVPFGSFLPKVKMNKLMKPGKLDVAKTVASIPSLAVQYKQISPLIVNNGMFSRTPTRALLDGGMFDAMLKRFESTYPGTARQQIFPAASGTQVVTFAAPTAAEGGNVLWAPMIIVQLGVSRQTSVAGAEIGAAFTSAIAESGVTASTVQWNVLFQQALDSVFLVFIPYIEVSSTIYPMIVEASAANNLVVTLTGLPAGSNLRVQIPGPDSAQYQAFKQGFGFGVPTTRLISNT